MIQEKINTDLKMIEEKINTKFLELKNNFEYQNKEINQEIQKINNNLKMLLNKNENFLNNSNKSINIEEKLSKFEKELKFACNKYDSILLSTKLKLGENTMTKKNQNKINDNNHEKTESKIQKDKQNLNDNQLEKIDNNKYIIDLLVKKIDEIKNDNFEYRELVKKINNEFNLIKIRFSEVLDFIKDKYFWKKFISKIIKENKIIGYKKNNKKENLIDINSIYNPFNYYEHFGIEEMKNFIDKGCNTKMYNNLNQNFLIDELKKDVLIDNNKFSTGNNTPNFNIIKNLKQKNSSCSLYNTNYKNIPKKPFFEKYLEQNSLNIEDSNDNIINSIQNNKGISLKENIINKAKSKLNEFIIQVRPLNDIDLDKNKTNSENLSEVYIKNQSNKIRKMIYKKKDQNSHRILPFSMKYNRNNSLNHFHFISNKDSKKGNLEDLQYSQLKKNKLDILTFMSGCFDEVRNNNNSKNKKFFPVFIKDKSQQ